MSQNTNQFPETQISLPKQNNFSKTQTNFSKHKSIYRNTKQFLKTQTNFPKHKSVYRNTKQFLKTQTNFLETQTKRLGTCAVIIREILEGTHSHDFPLPSWRLLLCCGRFNENVLLQLWIWSARGLFVLLSVWKKAGNCCAIFSITAVLQKCNGKRKQYRLTLRMDSATTLFYAFLRSIIVVLRCWRLKGGYLNAILKETKRRSICLTWRDWYETSWMAQAAFLVT